MHLHKFLMGLFTVAFMTNVWAEPALQTGDTLESLSKVQIRTTVTPSTTMMLENKPLQQTMPSSTEQPTEPENNVVDVKEIDAPILE